LEPLISDLHHQIIRGLLETGASPSNAELCRFFGVEERVLHERLHRLAEEHGVVLHPLDPRPWVII
jgi:DNA-binding GntR family transcriptional regulator